MILLNFGHPLTEEHLSQITEISSVPVQEVREIETKFDPVRPFNEQVVELVDGIGYSGREWQTFAILINPPALNLIALTLIAELHGRMGYFPVALRLKQIQGELPVRFEVAEIINLQLVRDKAREKR